MVETRDRVMEGYLVWCAENRYAPMTAWSIRRYRKVYQRRVNF